MLENIIGTGSMSVIVYHIAGAKNLRAAPRFSTVIPPGGEGVDEKMGKLT